MQSTRSAAQQRRYLMCRPTHFTVEYAINAWMDPTVPVDVDLAIAQWSQLREAYVGLGHAVDLIDPIPGLPDMVFAANGAFVIDGKVYGAQFANPQRAAEGPAYLSWFESSGFAVQAPKYTNEGEGDYLIVDTAVGRVILAGTGFRTEVAAHSEA
ncbi:MAG: dimethylarginine dimethylaminohydrolase family protein, partial [Micromonosporaceae bacterium]